MDIRDCSDYRKKQGKAYARTCIVCGLGPCRFPSGELLVDNTDLQGNTLKDRFLESIDFEAIPASPETLQKLIDMPAWPVLAVATATEQIECGQIVKIVRDPLTGICYARKA